MLGFRLVSSFRKSVTKPSATKKLSHVHNPTQTRLTCLKQLGTLSTYTFNTQIRTYAKKKLVKRTKRKLKRDPFSSMTDSLGYVPDEIPSAPIKEHVTELHGRRIIDPYHYLDSPQEPMELQTYFVDEQNYFSQEKSKHLSSMISFLSTEMRTMFDTLEMPSENKIGDYYYYQRPGQFETIYLRKRDLHGREEVILDGDVELEKHKGKLLIHEVKVSRDGRYLAFTKDLTGKNIFTLEIRDLQENLIVDTINPILFFEWGHDNELYYALTDRRGRPNRIMKRILGGTNDELVYKTDDPDSFVDIVRMKNYKHFAVLTRKGETINIKIMSVDGRMKELGTYDSETSLFFGASGDNILLCYTANNMEGPKAFEIQFENIETPEKWTPIVSFDANTRVVDLDTFEDFSIYYTTSNGRNDIYVFNRETKQLDHVKLPTDICSIRKLPNFDYTDKSFKFTFSSPVQPDTYYLYEPAKKILSIQASVEFRTPKGGAAPFDPKKFIVNRVEVGEHKIPLTLFHNKNIPKDGSNPTLMLVYGANGINIEPGYDVSVTSLVERGWVIAIAHVRGGSEKGVQWHRDGTGLNKMNSITDFIDCTQYLIDNKYTNSSLLCAKAEREGATILGYIANNYPSLFTTFVMRQPFLDITNSLLDIEGVYADEAKEWGNIHNQEVFDVVNKIDPYLNISRHDYPNMLIVGTPFDYKFSMKQQMKYTARLRASQTNDPTIILDLGIGFDPKFEQYRAFDETAQDNAFLFSTLNLFPAQFGSSK